MAPGRARSILVHVMIVFAYTRRQQLILWSRYRPDAKDPGAGDAEPPYPSHVRLTLNSSRGDYSP
jgi:hypothetical protein